MGFANIHVSHAHKLFSKSKRATTSAATDNTLPACKTGATKFITSPTIGQTVNALQTLNVTWDPTCLPTTSSVNIFLYIPGAETPIAHAWEGVALSRGSYSLELMPRWWNSTASQQLQVQIVPTGMDVFMSELPAGPVFTATYSAPASGAPASADPTVSSSTTTQVGDLKTNSSILTPGKKAAAALIPLLIVIACVVAYFRWKRTKEKAKRKEWTEKVDKRMSTISGDWKSVSAAGAHAAVRHSIAVSRQSMAIGGAPGVRDSSAFSFGGIRPASTIEEAAGNAGVGTKAGGQRFPGVGLRNPGGMQTTERVSRVSFAADPRSSLAAGERQSRVSFAADPRPSGESRRTRAFHSAYIPPVPSLPADISTSTSSDTAAYSDSSDSRSSEEAGSGRLSPRQTQGPLTLTPEDIRARIQVGRARAASNAAAREQSQYKVDEMDEVMPALSMMRTGAPTSTYSTAAQGHAEDDGDDLLFAPPAAPTPAYDPAGSYAYSTAYGAPAYPGTPSTAAPAYTPTTPVSPAMSIMPMPASVMSPDEMLRAYAERKKSLAATASLTSSASSISSGNPKISYPMPVADATSMPIAGGGASSGGMRVLYGANTGTYNPTTGAVGHQTTGSVGVGSYGGARYAIGEDEDAYGGTA